MSPERFRALVNAVERTITVLKVMVKNEIRQTSGTDGRFAELLALQELLEEAARYLNRASNLGGSE